MEDSKRIAGTDQVINYTMCDKEQVIGDERLDFAIDAVGSSEIVLEAIKYLKPGGTVCCLGVLKAEGTMLDASRLQNNTRVHMLNFPYGEYDILPETVAMIERGEINPKDFYSHVVPFNEVDRAIQLLEKREATKVILDFDI